MKILCIVGFNSVDSNTLMNTTIFYGLKRNGYILNLVTLKPEKISKTYHSKIQQYFDRIFYINDRRKINKRIQNSIVRMPYLLWINIVRDWFIKPYNKEELDIEDKTYDLILSFVPPSLSAFLANDIIKKNRLDKLKHIQYWSDPLSIGMCDDINKIPIKRVLHRMVETRLLKYATEIIYCTPKLCELQKQLYPQYAKKMRWTDVSFIERKSSNYMCNLDGKIKIGYFGAFQKKVRNIIPLLLSMPSFPEIQFVVRGDTDIDISNYLSSNLDILLGRVPYEDIAKLENECDILVCLGNIQGVQIPGKTFYYTNMNKPIIYIGDGYHNSSISGYIKQFNRHIICSNNEDSIRQAISEAIAVLPNFSLIIPERMKPEIVAKRIVLNQ